MNDLLYRPFLLDNPIQHYKWGYTGADAVIPQLLGISTQTNTHYAELWIGAHPSASSRITIEEKQLALSDLIHRFPELLLGKRIAEKFDNRLPFLFKVLSAAEPLSIQTHPTKRQAELLHNADPQHYPDSNHKPEIAIAIDSLTVLAGFKSYSQCQKSVERYPEMIDFFGQEALADIFPARKIPLNQHPEQIKKLYHTFIHLTQTKTELYQESVTKLYNRLQSKSSRRTEHEKIFLDACQKYPHTDVGLFSLFFLRLLHLKPGEAICLLPGIPHAYVRGNMIECMANSDNVIRAGLTPKYTDIQTLMTLLDYTPNPVKVSLPIREKSEYRYPVFTSEFKISRIELKSGLRAFRTENSIEIFLVLAGTGTLEWNTNESPIPVSRGQSYLIPGSLNSYTIASNDPLTVFRVQIP